MAGFKHYSADAQIVDIKKIAKDAFVFKLHHKEISERARAGMFLSVLAPGTVIRRPLAFLDADSEKGTFDILFRVVGKGTKNLSCMRVGDKLSVNAPLGNIFMAAKPEFTPVLIGGGSGIPPLYFFAKSMNKTGRRASVVLGANASENLYLKDEIKSFADLYLSTDDGSEGFKGNSVALLQNLIDEKKIENPYIYACGPTPMLRALKSLMLKKNIDGYFSFEAMMGCGVGMCQACALEKEKKNDNDKTEYALCCHNGPVFKYDVIKI